MSYDDYDEHYDPDELLRRPKYDPTDYRKLPDTSQTELDLPLPHVPAIVAGTWGRMTMIGLLGAIGVFFLDPLAELLGNKDILGYVTLTACVLTLVAIASLGRWARRYATPDTITLGIGTIVVVPTLLVLVVWQSFSYGQTKLGYLVIAIFGAVLLSDQAATHFVWWKTSARFTDLATARRLRALWHARWGGDLTHFPGVTKQDYQPTDAQQTAMRCYVVLALLAAIGIPLLLALFTRYYPEQLAILNTLAVVSLAAVAAQVMLAPMMLNRENDLGSSVKAVFMAIGSFPTYNKRNIRAGGLMQSPAGQQSFRLGITAAVLFLLAASLLRTADFWGPAKLQTKTDIRELANTRFNIQPLDVPEDSQKARFAGNWLMVYLFNEGLTSDAAWELTWVVVKATLTPLVAFFVISYFMTAPFITPLLHIEHESQPEPASATPSRTQTVEATALDTAAQDTVAQDTAQPTPEDTGPEADQLFMDPDGKRKQQDRIIDRIINSRDKMEQESLYVGRNAVTGAPVLLPPVSATHSHIIGHTGSGKTSVALMSYIQQLIRKSRIPGYEASVIVIDCKGDLADRTLFNTTMLEALGREEQFDKEHRVRNFKQVATELNFKCFRLFADTWTHQFNPLAHYDGHASQKAGEIQTDLNLAYGSGYGKGWFGDAIAVALRQVLLDKGEDLISFRQLARELHRWYEKTETRTQKRNAKNNPDAVNPAAMPDKIREAGLHAVSLIDKFAYFKPLNFNPGTNKKSRESIWLDQAFREPSVFYFDLPNERVFAPAVGRLILAALLRAADRRHKPSIFDHPSKRKPKQVFVIIDEFQKIVGETLEEFLDTARSRGVTVMMANQHLEQLPGPPNSVIRSTVQNATGFTQLFGCRSPDGQKYWSEMSGERIVETPSKSYKQSPLDNEWALETWTISEGVGPRFWKNDIARITADRNRSLVCIRDNDGYVWNDGLAVEVVSDWPLSKQLTDARAADNEELLADLPGIVHTDVKSSYENTSAFDEPL